MFVLLSEKKPSTAIDELAPIDRLRDERSLLKVIISDNCVRMYCRM